MFDFKENDEKKIYGEQEQNEQDGIEFDEVTPDCIMMDEPMEFWEQPDEAPNNVAYEWREDDFQSKAMQTQTLPTYGHPAMKPPKTKKRFWGYFSAGLAGVFLATSICLAVTVPIINSASSSPQSLIGAQLGSNKSGTLEQLARSEGSQLSVVDIAKKVGPAVVGILNEQEAYNFFGSKSTETGSGSGIIIRDNGYIITNNHVVDGAKSLTVVLSTGKEHKATVVGKDATTDLAVIKIDATGLPTAELGLSNELEVGELAVAIGNPLGQEFAGSVTVGVISALNRSVTVNNRAFTLVQTDAAINPGNSGGALVNSYGQVIGINSVKVQAAEGLGFAIPIDEAKPIIDELINNGYVTGRPVIGITPREITEEMSRQYNLPQGIYIVDVSPFSGAEKAGLQQSDIITEVNGAAIKTVDELNKAKDKFKAGDTLPVTVKRANDNNNWDTLKINIVLGEDKPTP